MARSKKKWDESSVTRDESGRFVAQVNVPMLGGQGSNPLYQRQLQLQQGRVQRIQQSTTPAGQQQILQQFRDQQQRQLNRLGGVSSSRRRSSNGGLFA